MLTTSVLFWSRRSASELRRSPTLLNYAQLRPNFVNIRAHARQASPNCKSSPEIAENLQKTSKRSANALSNHPNNDQPSDEWIPRVNSCAFRWVRIIREATELYRRPVEFSVNRLPHRSECNLPLVLTPNYHHSRIHSFSALSHHPLLSIRMVTCELCNWDPTFVSASRRIML